MEQQLKRAVANITWEMVELAALRVIEFLLITGLNALLKRH